MFSERLKFLRKKAGMTQIELATAFNIANGTVGNWETGKRLPDYEMLKEISAYFSVSIDYLLGNDINPHNVQHVQQSMEEAVILKQLSELTPDEKKKVLDFVEFTKQQRGK